MSLLRFLTGSQTRMSVRERRISSPSVITPCLSHLTEGPHNLVACTRFPSLMVLSSLQRIQFDRNRYTVTPQVDQPSPGGQLVLHPHWSTGMFPGKGGIVAPGMTCQYIVQFIPDCLGDFDDFILVETQSPHTLVIPLQARRPPPVLTCE